jgi:hypothetical protein
MEPTSPQPLDIWLNLLDPSRIGHLLLHRYTRLAVAWVVAVVVAWFTFRGGWYCMSVDTAKRADGNNAHVNIDFSGQYLLGRMIIKGEGRYLYHRQHQRPVLQEVYPPENEDHSDPEKTKHDWEEIEDWMIGLPETSEVDLGGPLYPPVHALLFAPLALLPPVRDCPPPLVAYRVMQVTTFLLTFIVAYLAERITNERIWCPVALVVVFGVPGYMGALGLGQNPLLTLTLLMAGWWLFTTKKPVLGGIVWGFLAYKPVWAVAFLPVLLLTARWRAAGAMVVTGIALGLATLPFVGWDCWVDWLAMGRLASDRYSWDENWLVLSRDLLNLPRRPFITHDDGHSPMFTYGRLLPDVLSYTLWIGAMAVSGSIGLLRRQQVSAAVGAGPAFLLLAGWMSCLHFMYYDVMLTFLPLCLLFNDPRSFLQVRFWRFRFWRPPPEPLPAENQEYYRPSLAPPPPMPLMPGGRVARWVINPLPPLLLVLLLALPPLMVWYDPGYRFPPVDTFCILAIWGWCGWTVWNQRTPALPAVSEDENPYPAITGAETVSARPTVLPVSVAKGDKGVSLPPSWPEHRFDPVLPGPAQTDPPKDA